MVFILYYGKLKIWQETVSVLIPIVVIVCLEVCILFIGNVLQLVLYLRQAKVTGEYSCGLARTLNDVYLSDNYHFFFVCDQCHCSPPLFQSA